jgi:hypothetical protein
VFLKLAAVIVSMGVVACILLSVRQQRVQAAHDLAQVQRRVLEHDRMLGKLRAEIAARTTPKAVELASRRFGTLVHNSGGRYTELVRRETEPAVISAAAGGRGR